MTLAAYEIQKVDGKYVSSLSQSPVLTPAADSAHQLQQGFSKFGPQAGNMNITGNLLQMQKNQTSHQTM